MTRAEPKSALRVSFENIRRKKNCSTIPEMLQ
jgi:hypothetical protein